MTTLVEHVSGTFAYLPGSSAFSNGLVVAPGHRIAEWEFAEPVPLRPALERIFAKLASRGLGWRAFAGLDLRSPTQFTSDGFASFNEEYAQVLHGYYPLGDAELPPYTRTNITPVEVRLSEPSVRAVQVIEPRAGANGDFVLSGVAENRGAPTAENIVAYLDTSAAGLRAKVDYVVAELASRLADLGPDLEARIVDVYAPQELDWLEPVIAGTFGAVGRFGLHRWLGLAPVADLEFEMGVKRVSSREILD